MSSSGVSAICFVEKPAGGGGGHLQLIPYHIGLLDCITHSSSSGRFRPAKIADFLGLLDHVCTLLEIYTTTGLYLCYPLQKTEPLYHIYNPF